MTRTRNIRADIPLLQQFAFQFLPEIIECEPACAAAILRLIAFTEITTT
jgi:hypothetical protein